MDTENIRRKRRSIGPLVTFVVGIAAPIGSVLFLFGVTRLADPLFTLFERYPAWAIGSLGVLAGAIMVVVMASYLRTRYVPSGTETLTLKPQLAQLQYDIGRLDQQTRKLNEAILRTDTRSIVVNPEDREILVADAIKRMSAGLSDDLYSTLSVRFQDEFRQSSTMQEAEESFQRVISRLYSAADSVGRGTTINLIAGVSACFFGLVALAVFIVVFEPAPTENWQEILARSLPRFSLVAILELLGFFFLGLYKLGTTEQKYFQNEITNVQLWAAAYLHAMRDGDKEIGKDIIKKVLSTERNFVLKKGERTAVSAEPVEESGLSASDIKDLLALVKKPKKIE